MRSSILRLGHRARRAHHRANDFDMRAAAAEAVAQRFHRLLFGRMRIAREQRLCRHDHAVEAVTALRGLFGDTGFLYEIRLVACAETFERYNRAADAAFDRDHAGARRDAVDQYGAGAALAEPTAVFRAVQFEVFAQHIV